MQELVSAKINFEPINDFQWDAQILNANQHDTIIEPNEAKLIENDKHPLPETFIRELVQNTLDAKLPEKNKQAKILNLEILDFNQPYTKDIYQRFVNGKILKWLVLSKSIEPEYKLCFKALIASDFNTTGLNGKLNDPNSNWNKYITRVGNPELSKDGSLGSAGIGKIATWSCSKLRMVFVRTLIDDPCLETRFIGRCLRRGNTELTNKKNFYRSSHEYFQNQSRQNVAVKEELNNFLSSKLFRSPRTSTGTDLLFPEFDVFTIEELFPYTLKNWFAPILDGELEINLNKENINKNNFNDLVKKYGTGEEGLDEEMMNFVTNTRNDECDIKLELKELNKNQSKSAKYTEDFFNLNNLSIKEISSLVNDGKHLIVEVPVVINSHGSLIKDRFYIGLKYRSEKKGRPFFGLTLRNYQILWEEELFTRDAKYHNDLMITVISKNSTTNKVLTYFEDATHLSFKKAAFKGKEEFEQSEAEHLLSLFRNVSNKIINLLLDEDESENKNLLKHLFSFKRTKNTRDKKKVKIEEEDDYIEEDDDTDLVSPEIDLDLPVSKPHLLNIDKVGKKLLINSINNETLCGKRIRIELGIKDQKGKGDAFKNINKFDLNFNSQTEISYYSGCFVDQKESTQTAIEVEIENDYFEIEIEGFKDYLTHKIRYSVIK